MKMKTTHKLVKNSDFGKIAPGGRIESYWTDQNVNLDQTKIVNLVEEYKLAGIEFGNWVPQDERLLYVEDIYKGLPVFCKFLGIKHNQLGQNKITLAFGARGMRKAKAHWEPWSYAMNLTRKAGRRSFLHEYIHALDTILYDSLKNEYGTNPQRLFSAYFTTSGSGQFYLNNSRIFEQNLQRHITETGVRGAIARLLWNLCFYVDKKGDKVDVKWSKLYTNCKNNGEYWAYPWEILARSFESYFAHDFMAKKDDTNNAFKAVAKSTNFFSGKGVNTTVYPKATLVKELNMYFEDVMECFQWVLDAKEFGKPNKSEPKLAPKSSIINEATDLDLEKARKSRSEAIKKAEVKKPEVKKPEKKKIEVKKPERKKPEKVQRPRKKVAQTKKPEIKAELTKKWDIVETLMFLAKETKDHPKVNNNKKYRFMKEHKGYLAPLELNKLYTRFIQLPVRHRQEMDRFDYENWLSVNFNKILSKPISKIYAEDRKEYDRIDWSGRPYEKPIFEDIIDAFINSMELYESAEEFANEFGTRPGKISKQWLKNAYEEYWKVDPMDRLKWDQLEWRKWITSNRIKFDKPESKTETKPESKTESKPKITEEDYEYASLLKYHMRVFTRWNINQLYDVKIEDIIDHLNDEFQNKKIPSWSSGLNTLPDELRKKTFKEPHDKDGQLFIQELAWYCAVAGQGMLGNKPVKSVVDLIKKLGRPSGIDNTVFPFVKPRNFVKMNQQNVSIGFDDLKYIIDRMASDDQYRPAMMGIYYDVEDQNIVMTDSYKLIIMPTKKFANSITNSLHENATTLIGAKGYKNFHKIDDRFPPYKNVLTSEENLKFIFWIDVDEELDKCKQLKFYTKFHSQLSTSKQFVKFSDDGDYFAMNFTYYQDVLETLKKLGKKQAQVFKEDSGNSRTKAHYFVADDIKILLMPVRWNFSEDLSSIDPKLYQFSKGTPDNLKVIPMFDDEVSADNLKFVNSGLKSFLKQLENNEGLSDLDEKGDLKLFDDISEIVETNSIEFLDDDITAPSLEVNSKYDLPEPMVNNNAEVVTVQQMRKNKIKPMQLPSKYKSLLGNVPNNFRMLLWGAPGHGKSSLALTIGNDIARKCKVLFVSAEESVQSATLQNRIKRFKANSRNLMFNDTTNPAIIESIIAKLNPKFIIIDSVNVIQGKVEAIIDLMLKYPDIGFIVIAQATKDHKRYSGLGSLAHAVDIVVNVKSGTATAEKNRYASLGSMPVKGITI